MVAGVIVTRVLVAIVAEAMVLKVAAHMHARVDVVSVVVLVISVVVLVISEVVLLCLR